MSLYDPERDRVRLAGRLIRWLVPWVLVPVVSGVFVSGNLDVRSLPLLGGERQTAVLFQDGQAYFGHLDDSGESGTLVLRDVYYFADAKGGPTGLPVGLVRRGTEAHEPADGMRINRDRVLAVERLGGGSAVAQAIQAERQITHTSPAALSLNRVTVGTSQTLAVQRTAAEHYLQRAFTTAAEQLAKLNELVLPISKAQAQTITQRALTDLRTVRRNALGAVGTTLGLTPSDAEAYARATDPQLEGQTFANEPGILLAPDLNAIVNGASQLYAQVGDVASKELTQPRASASPSPSPKP
jgi:hypothetical protein